VGVTLEISDEQFDRLTRHLASGPDEQLAFLLARWHEDVAKVTDLRLIEARSFDLQTPWHLSLSDDERAAVIKWTHDNDASLIEAHVHRGWHAAEFSGSDWSGLDAFVPHVWWRLRHRPYIALVFADSTFDALVWRTDATTPETLAGLVVRDRPAQRPTGRSLPRRGFVDA
jgi:hypothetical protein